MKVAKNNKIKFSQVPCGDIFELDSEIFIKVKGRNDDGGLNLNACSIEHDNVYFCTLNEDDEVIHHPEAVLQL